MNLVSSPVIVALDFESRDDAPCLVDVLGAEATFYKVGLQMLTAAGPEIVRALVAMGQEVFLDLKTHEIPSSVAAAVVAAGKLGCSMVTVHASGGRAVLRSAVEADRYFPKLKILALTVITSLTDQELPEIGLRPSVAEQVERLALLASSQGCHGVVASAKEAEQLSRLLPAGSLIVTPGIQLTVTKANDQSRFATPAMAAAAGATYIVIGRAIAQANDPLQVFREVVRAFGH